jgi:site-specific DNA recombinase
MKRHPLQHRTRPTFATCSATRRKELHEDGLAGHGEHCDILALDRQAGNAGLANPMTGIPVRREKAAHTQRRRSKGSKRYRYYVSQAILKGDNGNTGSIARVSAPQIESRVLAAIGEVQQREQAAARVSGHRQGRDDIATPASHNESAVLHPNQAIRSFVDRVTLERSNIRIVWSADIEERGEARTLVLPWTPSSPYRRRDIIQSSSTGSSSARSMPQGARLLLIEALRKAHRWLDELLAGPQQTIEAIAAREGKTERSIRMILSLAFLAPDLVKAATDGRLPRGFGFTRLMDLPIAWTDQWDALGLKAPVRS